MVGRRYATLVADPPWPHRDGFANNPLYAGTAPRVPIQYPTLDLEAIAALPVASLALPDARLFLWATNRFLPAAFEVMAAWGFRYAQTLVWHKIGRPSPWGGSVAPNHAEYLLVGARGAPGVLDRWDTNVLRADVTRYAHSVKPDVFLDLAERVSPGPYLELFARRQRLGWDTWGNQALEHVQMSLEEGA